VISLKPPSLCVTFLLDFFDQFRK